MGNNSICSCNFKQEENEENIYNSLKNKDNDNTKNVNNKNNKKLSVLSFSSDINNNEDNNNMLYKYSNSNNISNNKQNNSAISISLNEDYINDSGKKANNKNSLKSKLHCNNNTILSLKQSNLFSEYLKTVVNNYNVHQNTIFNKEQFFKICLIQNSFKRYLIRKQVLNKNDKFKNTINSGKYYNLGNEISNVDLLKSRSSLKMYYNNNNNEYDKSNNNNTNKEVNKICNIENNLNICYFKLYDYSIPKTVKDNYNDFDNSNFSNIIRKNKLSFNNNLKFGIQVYNDGAKYVGQFTQLDNNNNNNNNNNSQAISNTVSIKNNYNNYACHGLGMFKHLEGDSYKGEFKNNEANGYGIFNQIQLISYEGEWLNDSQQGIGIEKWEDGSEFIGNFTEGLKNKIGKQIWTDGSMYEGEWTDNNLNGYGIYKFSDGRIYAGMWENNSMHGYGEFCWNDGKKYLGFYENDEKSGFGMYLWRSPLRIYAGFWSRGKRHGLGRYISDTNDKYGIWIDGTRKEWITLNSKEYNTSIKENVTDKSLKYLKILKLDSNKLCDLIINSCNFN